jgi:hypothetical protein
MPTLPPCLETIPDQPIIGVMRPRCEQVRIERNEKHLGKLRVGDYFGEMGLLLEQRPGYPLPRLRSAYALTPNTLLALLTFEVHQLPPPPPPPTQQPASPRPGLSRMAHLPVSAAASQDGAVCVAAVLLLLLLTTVCVRAWQDLMQVRHESPAVDHAIDILARRAALRHPSLHPTLPEIEGHDADDLLPPPTLGSRATGESWLVPAVCTCQDIYLLIYRSLTESLSCPATARKLATGGSHGEGADASASAAATARVATLLGSLGK